MNCRPCVYGPLPVIRALGSPGGRSPFSGDAPDGVLTVEQVGIPFQRLLHLTVLHFAFDASAPTSAAGVNHPCVFPEGTNHEP